MFDWKSTGTNQGIAAQELGQVLNTWAASSTNSEATEIFRIGRDEVVFRAGSNEMLRIARDGFRVRGVAVAVDSGEAATVYRAFEEWLVWAQLNRP